MDYTALPLDVSNRSLEGLIDTACLGESGRTVLDGGPKLPDAVGSEGLVLVDRPAKPPPSIGTVPVDSLASDE